MGEMSNRELPYKRKEWCKGCGLCAAFCPRGVLVLEIGKINIQNPENCIKCGLCQQICPDYAIYAGGGEDEEEDKFEQTCIDAGK